MARVPAHLLDEFARGNVVAFVGSGFTAAAGFPQWRQLLLNIAADAKNEGKLGDDAHATVVALLASQQPSAHQLDQAAQLLDDFLQEPGAEAQAGLVAGIRRHLSPARFPFPDALERRLELLRALPFKAILTTNFNPLVQGATPFDADASATFRSVLRGDGVAPNGRVAKSNAAGDGFEYADAGCPVLQIHGDLSKPESVVLTREGYRRLLYSRPAYGTFIRACLAGSTVLYCGFSFSDAYLNELRSEVVGLVGAHPHPLGYAIINDMSAVQCDFFRTHEGLQLLTFDTEGGTKWEGFNQWLDDIKREVDARNIQR